ncbi:transcriptional regulator [Pseudomonas sp.]|uniref:helix-turn-helix transcriptional regulator n=1 Tax=Pseudomonas sp. TaxID=306 RepID=UPI0025F296FD|nr:transcriptional regulator [Pseudomonas sp.]
MTPHNPSPARALVRQTALCNWLDLPRSGLDKLRRKDPTFPKPIKDGDARQAAAFYVFAEVEAWRQTKIASRDAA